MTTVVPGVKELPTWMSLPLTFVWSNVLAAVVAVDLSANSSIVYGSITRT